NFEFSVFYLPSMRDGRLLEIGVGSGQMLAAMRTHGWQVEGVDLDPAAVRNAQAKGLPVKLGTLEEQNYPDCSFDAIVMSHVIEHVPAPVSFLNECRRVLKPHGRLVLITPNSDSLGHRLYDRNWRGLEPPRHLHIFNP